MNLAVAPLRNGLRNGLFKMRWNFAVSLSSASGQLAEALSNVR